MKEKFAVTFIVEKPDGSYYEKEFECNDMISVTRLFLGFKPKKGCKVVQMDCRLVPVLF